MKRRPVGRWAVTSRVALMLSIGTMAMAAVSVAGRTSHPQPQATECTGEITGTVDALVVPPGAVCVATDVVVMGRVFVGPRATLRTVGTFNSAGGISVASEATLTIQSSSLRIGGNVTAEDALSVSLIRIPTAGSSGTVEGDVVIKRTAGVSLLGLTIGGSASIQGSGADGLEVGTSQVTDTLSIRNNAIVGGSAPALFAVHFNTVGETLFVINNDAARAFEPPFVGGNRVLAGNLVCQANVPAPTNVQAGGAVFPNVVLNGDKLGQCANL